VRIWSTRDRSQAFALIGDVVLQVTAARVSREAWDEYLELLGELYPEHVTHRLLNFSPTFAPTASQITTLVKRYQQSIAEVRMVSVVTSSVIVRKVINAVAWMMPAPVEIRSYHPERACRAVDWIFEGSGQDAAAGHEIFTELMAHTGWTAAARPA
jgi:hypothetical protein